VTDSVRHAKGRRVVDVTTGDNIGTVAGFVLASPPHAIQAVAVRTGRRSSGLVEWADVRGFGPDAVVVQAEPRDALDDHEQQVLDGSINVVGSRILDTDGFARGTVTDVVFDPSIASVLEVVGDQGRWDAASVRGLGSYALVVDGQGSGEGRSGTPAA
jgi:uncharacterized protein YrrD